MIYNLYKDFLENLLYYKEGLINIYAVHEWVTFEVVTGDTGNMKSIDTNMLNKNTLGVKKCEANQKQHC